MPLSAAAKNAMLDNEATRCLYLSLHTANPGSTGASEVTGGSPAYARKSATWTAAANGVAPLSASPTFDIPGSTTFQWVGFFTSSSGSTGWQGYVTLANPVVISSQGTWVTVPIALDINAVQSA